MNIEVSDFAPLPPAGRGRTGRPRKYPFAKLKAPMTATDGEQLCTSFFVPIPKNKAPQSFRSTVDRSAHMWATKHPPLKFTTRWERDASGTLLGLRVYRIA